VRPFLLPQPQRWSTATVSLSPILETSMSPALRVPGVFDIGMLDGTIVTPYGLGSTAIVLPCTSTMNAVFPTTAILDNPFIVLMSPLRAAVAYVETCVANTPDTTSTSGSMTGPMLVSTASRFCFLKSILLCDCSKAAGSACCHSTGRCTEQPLYSPS
jgi:hypothetical protein